MINQGSVIGIEIKMHKENYPELMNKWDLNLGRITSEFIEKIGGDIDLVFHRYNPYYSR